MRLYDEVKVINDKEEYKKEGVSRGMVGTIWSGEIRDNSFLVLFIDPRYRDKEFFLNEDNIYKLKDDILLPMEITDLEVIKDNHATDEQILEDLPSQDLRWWCKVEDGYILNLKGERKNKIPYDYDS